MDLTKGPKATKGNESVQAARRVVGQVINRQIPLIRRIVWEVGPRLPASAAIKHGQRTLFLGDTRSLITQGGIRTALR